MDRLVTELFGKLVADRDIADRLAVTGPQRLEGSGPGGTPCQLHVGEGVEELLRTRAAQPFARGINRIGGLRRRLVADTGDEPAIGIQRPLSVALPAWAAVYLEGPAAVLDRMYSQLHLPGSLLAQNDRFVEEDIAHLRRRPNRGKCHRRVRRARNDNGAIDDVMRQPRLRFDGPPAGVHGVARGEILRATQDSGSGSAVAIDAADVGILGPEATALERIGRQLESAAWPMLQRSELGTVPGDIDRG